MWNTPSDIRPLIGITSDELTDDELTSYINDAYYQVIAEYGPYLEDSFYYNSEENPNKIFQASLKPLIEITKVIINNEPTTNYTTDLDNGTITINEDLAVGSQIIIQYIPTIFKLLEKYIAVKNIILTRYLDTGSDTVNVKIDNLTKKIDELREVLNKKSLAIGRWIDRRHYLPTMQEYRL